MINTNKKEYYSNNILSEEGIIKLVKYIRKRGKTVGLCMGGFDLIHPGHITHLRSAKSHCDYLIIGVSCDKHQRERKGPSRPVYPEELRAFSIAQLKSVDYVFISYKTNAIDHIKHIKPNYYIKGSDYSEKRKTPNIILERSAASQVGTKMRYTIDEKLSTTEIIKYILKNLK